MEDLHITLQSEIDRCDRPFKISVQHELGLTSSSEEEEEKINVLADEIKSSQDFVPIDNDDSVEGVQIPPVADINDPEVGTIISIPAVEQLEDQNISQKITELETVVSIPPASQKVLRKVRKK